MGKNTESYVAKCLRYNAKQHPHDKRGSLNRILLSHCAMTNKLEPAVKSLLLKEDN